MSEDLQVLWSEGALLSQQYMQQFQQTLHWQMQKMSIELQPFTYGLISLTIDEEKIVNHVFCLKNASGYFDNGRYFNIASNISLPDCKEGDVYLCLNANESVSKLDGYKSYDNNPTYLAEIRDIADIYDQSRKADIIIKKENFYLSQEKQQHCHQLKIASLCKKNGTFLQLSHLMIPVCLNAFASSVFSRYINEEINFLVKEKSYYQGKQKNTLSYQAIISYLNKLRCAQQFQHYSPWQFYIDSQLFISRLDAEGELGYQHQNIFENCYYFREKYRQLLHHKRPVLQKSLQLVRESAMLYLSENLQSVFAAEASLYLWLSLAAHDPRVQDLSKTLKVLPLSELDRCVQGALPGLTLSLEYIEEEMLSQQGCYFKLDQNHPLFAKVLTEKQVAVFITQNLLDVEIKLIARGNNHEY